MTPAATTLGQLPQVARPRPTTEPRVVRWLLITIALLFLSLFLFLPLISVFVQAFAYDADNQVLKEFYPKDIKKVNGQWQVGMMEMDNDTTDSRTRLVFDLDATSPQK